MFIGPCTFILLTNFVILCLGDVNLTCSPLTVPLGSRVTLHCSTSPGGLDIKSSNNPDIPVFATAQEGYVTSNQELTIEVIESSPSKLNVSITFNVTLRILDTIITCSSFNDGQYEVCPISYSRPHLDPHAEVSCVGSKKNEDDCSLTSLSWNCSRSGLPLERIEISLGSEEKVSIPGNICSYNSTKNQTGSSVNLILIGYYVTNYSATVTTFIDLHSPFLISKNESEEDNTTFMFDVAQDQRTVLVLSLLQSNNFTIQNKATAPLIIRIPRNVNISYTIGTLLVFDNITIFYLEHDTYQLCLECNHHENGTVASGSATIQYELIVILLVCSSLYCYWPRPRLA